MDKHLSDIDSELLMFKDSQQKDTNYDHIYNLAEAMPVLLHLIVSFSQTEKSVYFGVLLMVATHEDSISEQQLLFLQRMVMADANSRRIDYYMGNLGKIQLDNVIFHLGDETVAKYGKQLVLDAIIVAKLGKNCTGKSWQIIADIATIFGIPKEVFAETCKIAAAILTQSSNTLTGGLEYMINVDRHYGYYLQEITDWKKRSEKAWEEYSHIEEIKEKAQKELLLQDLCRGLQAVKRNRT